MGGLSSSLGGLVTGLSTINQAVGLVDNFSGADEKAEQGLALRQLQEAQALQERQAAAENALERERIAAAAGESEAKRQRELKRAVARQRAEFGASGVGNAASGSQEAVLLGLFSESEEERAERERIDGLRSQSLDLRLDNLRSANLLQQEQLRQKQNLASATSASDFLDFGAGISSLF